MSMNKYWPHLTALGAVFFVGLLFFVYKASDMKIAPAQIKERTNIQRQISPTATLNNTANTVKATPKTFPLSVIQPSYSTSENSKIIVAGITSPNAQVMINDVELTADKNGNFSTGLTLDEGENWIIVSANDEAGEGAEKEITVTYNPE